MIAETREKLFRTRNAFHDPFVLKSTLAVVAVLAVAPLVIAALVVHEGLSSSAVKLVLIGVLLIGSGAVTVSAFGRAAAQRAGLVETDSLA